MTRTQDKIVGGVIFAVILVAALSILFMLIQMWVMTEPRDWPPGAFAFFNFSFGSVDLFFFWLVFGCLNAEFMPQRKVLNAKRKA